VLGSTAASPLLSRSCSKPDNLFRERRAAFLAPLAAATQVRASAEDDITDEKPS
jgi:hypothetical protein